MIPEPTPLHVAIAERLTARLASKELTTGGVAQRLHVSEASVRSWKFSRSLPRSEPVAEGLLRMLGLSAALPQWRAWRDATIMAASGRGSVARCNKLPATSIVGRWVRKHRLARGWSQRRLAEEAGVAPNTVAAWEAERRHISRLNRISLSQMFGELPPDDCAEAVT